MSTILYYGEFQHFGYCENWIAAALDRNGFHCIRLRRSHSWFDEQRLLQIARQNDATILLLSKTPDITPEQLRYIKSHGIRVVFWTFDWMRHPATWEWYGPLAKEADVCFQTDGWGENEFYRSEGIKRVEVHQGCEPGLHELPRFQTIARSSLSSDVMFIGSTYTDRRKQLIDVLNKQPHFMKWGEPSPTLWGSDFATAAYCSKILIGDNFVNDIAGYWSDRVYLTLACGGFFLTAYVEGIEQEFENHKHLVTWSSFEELNDLIKYYLPREHERRAIALNGYRRVHERHTYNHRIAELVKGGL